jgi:uncharacterized protein (TIGR03083 family)
MPRPDVWPTIASERAALVADLETLRDEQWDTPSMCDGWTVRDVVAHMTATAKITPASFFPKLLASGFSLTRMQTKDLTIERGATPADALSRFRSVVHSKKHPPGPIDTWLGEVIIHAEDARRPLGIAHAYPTDAVARVADFYKGSSIVVGAKKRIAGLRLTATDTDWSHGTGPEVAGPITSLVLAMTGRRPAIADLSGDGVATLSSRE